VFDNSIALGIHSGYLPGQGAVYSTIDNAEFGLGVTLCVNAACTP
jgi:hypothetical protein